MTGKTSASRQASSSRRIVSHSLQIKRMGAATIPSSITPVVTASIVAATFPASTASTSAPITTIAIAIVGGIIAIIVIRVVVDWVASAAAGRVELHHLLCSFAVKAIAAVGTEAVANVAMLRRAVSAVD